ncbi:MAG: ATPase domain-containing protein [Candidatus Aenigmatarchaeota archaeon]
MVERIKTGIPGLDDLIGGGFPQSSTILLSGVAGAGKTIFCLQFIYNGAYVYNEPGVYISLEEEPERLISYAVEEFNWNFKELIEKKMVSFVSAEMYSFEKLRDLIETEVTKLKAKRLVIDPSTILGLYFEKALQVRKSILDLTRLVKRLGCTTILVSEIEEGSGKISGLGVEEFVADGIIILYYIKEAGFYTRGLCVRKMRATDHDSGVHPIQITKNGLVVFPKEQIFAGKV